MALCLGGVAAPSANIISAHYALWGFKQKMEKQLLPKHVGPKYQYFEGATFQRRQFMFCFSY